MATVNVRYMVDDVDAAIAFYTTHLASGCSRIKRRRSLTFGSATCACCSADRRARLGGRCRTAVVRGPGG